MTDFPTYQELFRVARDEVLLRNSLLTRDIVERAGSDANALVAVGPAVGDTVVGQLIRVNVALFLLTAKGSDLDRLVFDRYQMVRKPASPALGEVEFTTSTPVGTGFAIPIGTQLKTSDNISFTTTEQVIFPSGSSGPISVAVQSTLAGLNQQARIGTITSIISSIPSAPTDLAVTNSQATAGADDEESDELLRDRALRAYITSQRGTLAAIEFGARAVPGVRQATVFEVVDASSNPARLVEVVIADAFTEQLINSVNPPSTYEIQAATLSLTTLSKLRDYRAAGIQVVVTIASVKILGITLLLRYRENVDVAETTAAARARIVAYVNSLRPGQTFERSIAEELLSTVPGLVVLGGEVVSPSLDVTAAPLEVLRTSSGYVTVGTAL